MTDPTPTPPPAAPAPTDALDAFARYIDDGLDCILSRPGLSAEGGYLTAQAALAFFRRDHPTPPPVPVISDDVVEMYHGGTWFQVAGNRWRLVLALNDADEPTWSLSGGEGDGTGECHDPDQYVEFPATELEVIAALFSEAATQAAQSRGRFAAIRTQADPSGALTKMADALRAKAEDERASHAVEWAKKEADR